MSGERGDKSPPVGPDGTLLDTIALHSTNLLTLLDAEGRVRYESPAIERIYGFEQEELVGEPVEQYIHPEDRERALAAFRRVVTAEEHTVESVEFRHRTADDTYLWVEAVTAANPTPEGYYVVNTRDISRAKQRERRLEQTNERLEELSSMLSHDIRSPLTVAQLRLQLAAEECNSDHLAAIERAHDRIEALVTDVLTLARSGEQLGKTELVALAPLVSDCWESVASWDAAVHCEVTGRIRADPIRLPQLFENLFRNAIEHTDGDVTVTVGPLENGFYVEDDGPGIPLEKRDAVFEAGHSDRPEGTGLGLQIVEQIAQAHGWEVQIADADGARFEITGVETG